MVGFLELVRLETGTVSNLSMVAALLGVYGVVAKYYWQSVAEK